MVGFLAVVGALAVLAGLIGLFFVSWPIALLLTGALVVAIAIVISEGEKIR